MKKMIAVIILMCLLCGVFSSAVVAGGVDSQLYLEKDEMQVEEKVYSNASIEDKFADNRIMVVLSNEKSLEFNDVNASDFADVGCLSVRDLTQETTKKVKTQIESLKMLANSKVLDMDSADVNCIQSYNQVLCLELEGHSKENVLDTIEELQERDDVIYAGPDYIISVGAIVRPNDTLYNHQWANELIQVQEAWDLCTGSELITVGVIDTGIDATHPDLVGRVNVDKSVDFTNYFTYLNTATDPNGHGTHVAGIIGARTHDATGVAGVCYNISLISLRVFDQNGEGYSSNLIRAVEYAENLNIPVLNLSARWYVSDEHYDFAVKSVIENYSGVFVCVAGNENRDNDIWTVYPTNYELENMISVGASTETDTKWDGSNYSDNSVHIFAPGVNILSTVPTSVDSTGYKKFSGTSMAAPYVTAVVALMLARNPYLSPAEIKEIIMISSDKSEGFADYCVSGGRLNAYRAVLYAGIYENMFQHSMRTDEIEEDTSNWYRFVVPSDGIYYFYTEYTEDEVDTKGELFYEIVPDGSTVGRIVVEDDQEEPDDGNDPDMNFYMVVTLEEGDVVYLRVTAYDDGEYTLRVSRSSVEV